MKYYIIFKPVFYKRDKTLAGYDMAVRVAYLSQKWADYDMISVEKDDAAVELARFQQMLHSANYDITAEVSFVDKHPLDILRYLRGEKEPKKERNSDWVSAIDNWSVNVRGERV